MKAKNITLALLILILLASIFLIFKNLSNIYLWQDEAESAALARNTVKFGYPRAFDGTNLLNAQVYTGFGKEFQWKYHPWLHFYIITPFYLLFGVNTFSARLPFAILGFLSIILAFFLAKRLFKKDSIALLAALFISTSVPFLLLVRQSRYYAPQIILTLIITWAYLNLLEKKKKSVFILGASLLALYYTNNGVFMPVFFTVIIHFFLFNKEKKLQKSFIFMSATVILLALPWAIYSYSKQHIAVLDVIVLKKNLEFQIRVLNKYIFPGLFFIILYLIHCFKNKAFKISIDKNDKNGLFFILILLVTNICFFIIVEQRMMRYHVHLFPFLYILQAWLLLIFFSNRKIILVILIAVLMFTNILHNSLSYLVKAVFSKNEKREALLKKVEFYLPKYLYEITHDYDGPVEGSVKFLKQYAKPGDAVKVAYDDASFIFYLPYLKIENTPFFDNKDFPEWIVWRDYWIKDEYASYCEKSKNKNCNLGDEKYTQEIKTKYIAHEIPYPDIIWENRPDDLEYHKFKTVESGRKVIIYERIK